MPRPPVGVALLRERPGERVVGRAAVVRRRVVVHRRSQQRIAELDRALTDRDDASLLGSGQARGVGADRRDGIVDGRHRGLVAGCGYEQRPSRLGREREDAALIDAAHARGSRQRADDRLAPRKLRGCQAFRQRRKRQGVAARVAPELFEHIRGLDDACQQLPHLVELEPAESQLLEAAVVERARPVRPFRGNQSDPADVEASCDEAERVPRPGIEVVRIVDQQQYRLLVCRRHQQAQCACEHLEAMAGLGVAEPESTAQGARLHRRDQVQPGEHGGEQLVQARERQIRLCGHASRREHEPAVRICGDLLEQVALADPWLAAHDECPAAAVASFREQLSDAATLGDPSDEHGTAILCTRWGRAQAVAPGYLGVNDPGCFVTEASAHARNPRMRYPPIAEHGVIGDLHTVALVAVDGTIDWYCCPSFDSPSVFAALLDADRGGYFRIAPVEIVSSQATMLRRIVSGADRERRSDHKQLYFPDTNVLITRFLDADGVCEVQDFMPIQPGRPHGSGTA